MKKCEDCGKILTNDTIGNTEIDFNHNSKNKYWCKECSQINDIIDEFLCKINKIKFGTSELSLDLSKFMEYRIKKLLNTKTPKKYIEKYKY